MSGTQRKRGFDVIGEAEPMEAPAPAANAELTALNTKMLLLALRSLSQRATTAITNLFTLGLVASAWLLLSRVLDNPTTLQLVALSGYAVFCVLIDLIRRKSRP